MHKKVHIHTLSAKQHAYFLAQERHDPVTGDSFFVGEEVVFCAVCGSAFHVESWAYMGNKHCNQQDTLVYFPKPPKKGLSLRKRRAFGQNLKRASWKKRLKAFGIDLACAAALEALFPMSGAIFMMVRDVRNFSPGKFFTKLRMTAKKQYPIQFLPIDIARSGLRNFPLLLTYFLLFMWSPTAPLEIALYFAASLVALALNVMEAATVLNGETRILDLMQETDVVEPDAKNLEIEEENRTL